MDKKLLQLFFLLVMFFSCNRNNYNSSSVATIQKPNLSHTTNPNRYYSQVEFTADSCGQKVVVNTVYRGSAFIYKHAKPGSQFVVNYDSTAPRHFEILDYQPVLDSTKRIDTAIGTVTAINIDEGYFTYHFKSDSSQKNIDAYQALPPKKEKDRISFEKGDKILVRYITDQPVYSIPLPDSVISKRPKKIEDKEKHGAVFINLLPILGLNAGAQYIFNPYCSLGFSVMHYYAPSKNFVFNPELRLILWQPRSDVAPMIKIYGSYVYMNKNRSDYFNVPNIPRDSTNESFMGMNPNNKITSSEDLFHTWGAGVAFGMLYHEIHNPKDGPLSVEFTLGIHYYNPTDELLQDKTIGNEEYYYHNSIFQSKMSATTFWNKKDPSQNNYKLNFLNFDFKVNMIFLF